MSASPSRNHLLPSIKTPNSKSHILLSDNENYPKSSTIDAEVEMGSVGPPPKKRKAKKVIKSIESRKALNVNPS